MLYGTEKENSKAKDNKKEKEEVNCLRFG